MNFWGQNTRKEIAKNFDIIPLNHTCVLNNQKIISECSKKELEVGASYYKIKLIDKNNDSISSTHFLAKDTAEELLEFASQSKLMFFNPITGEYKEIKIQDKKGNIKNSQFRTTINQPSKLNKEAYHAIRIVILACNFDEDKLKDPLKKFFHLSQQTNDIESPLIQAFNTTLKKLGSMKQLCSKIEQQGHGKVKDFHFPLMKKILIEKCKLKEEDILL